MVISKRFTKFVEIILRNKLKKKLGDISSIQTGLFAKTEAEGDIVYLQSKHFDEEGLPKTSLHPDLRTSPKLEKHLLQLGDILFAAKGAKNFAVAYKNHNQPCIASTTFFIIRLNNDSILPEYLTWYINNPIVLQNIKAKATGTSMVSISKSVLEDLEVAIPDIHMQMAIIKIADLRKTEIKLKQDLETLNEKLIQQQIFKAINR